MRPYKGNIKIWWDGRNEESIVPFELIDQPQNESDIKTKSIDSSYNGIKIKLCIKSKGSIK